MRAAPVVGAGTAVSASAWLGAMNGVRDYTARVAGLSDPLQAARLGFTHGGLFALDWLQGLTEAGGCDIEQAIALVRAFWRQDIAAWADAPTEPGQEAFPLFPPSPDTRIPGAHLRIVPLVPPASSGKENGREIGGDAS